MFKKLLGGTLLVMALVLSAGLLWTTMSKMSAAPSNRNSAAVLASILLQLLPVILVIQGARLLRR